MRKKAHILILFCTALIALSCNGQKEKEKYSVTKINDSTFRYESYYPNKQKKTEFYVNKDKKYNGKYYKWNHLGVKYIEWNFVNGLQDGEQIDYWETGQKSLVSYYKDGVLDGAKISYDTNGEFMLEERYNKGKLVYRKEAKDFYKPPAELVKIFISDGVDSATAAYIIKNNLSGYIMKTDSGTVVVYDSVVKGIVNRIVLKIDSIQQSKKLIQVHPKE